ncbi:hypothetical protein MYAM1_001174 [Malassezia yamatoensis]|uniref:C2H2-type domain-containing protein n=1 Tax=Malassezia yamatoensis TaxID=253288 RepID=A0AAJ5YRJ8_9BASI|nr:hypothetical protein MYAM1_001174 [Malassezia yamatoensis]
MQTDDFVLFDDDANNQKVSSSSYESGQDPRNSNFNKPSFLQHRGIGVETSPVLDDAPYLRPSQLGLADPTLVQRAMQGDVSADLPGGSHPMFNANSPNRTPPQPSSGTLGAPLNLLSLQGDERDSNRALFPDLNQNERKENDKQGTYMLDQQVQDWPYSFNKSISNDGIPPKSKSSNGWKAWGNSTPGLANPDMLRAAADRARNSSQQENQASDRLTVSPRDLYLGNDGIATPQAPNSTQAPSSGPSLFPTHFEDGTGSSMPFGISSAMEAGSSTEEEDDEDERPFPSSSYAGSVLGAAPPNSQLLDQWSRSTFASTSQHGQERPPTSSQDWPMAGPSFSAMSTSSESEEDTPVHPSLSNRHLSEHASQFANTVPGALGGYGYIPGSQESGMSVQSQDYESGRGSQMSVSMTEDDNNGAEDRHRSPSILNSAQPIFRNNQQRVQRKSPVGSEHTDENLPVQPSRQTSSENNRSVQSLASVKARTPSADRQRPESRPSESTSPESSSPYEEESDYEQTQLAQPTPRAANKRGRQTRTSTGAYARTSSTSRQQSPSGHSGVIASAARSAQNASSSNSSAIRCDYVSPASGQRCGTIFHRMYDLARHRVTLHLREEAQLVKDGMLKVEDCVVLGKEVDVKKALSELEWICRTCGASFSRKDAMLRHERLRHHR